MALLLVPSAVAATTPTAPDLDLTTAFGSLLLVIAFIVVLAWLVKRMQGQGFGRVQGLKLVSQLPVGTKERIAVVQAGEAQYLVGITPHSISLIAQLESPLANAEPVPASFSQQFQQVLQKQSNRANASSTSNDDSRHG